MAYKSQVTITRPANTTAYTAGDVVGDTSGSAVLSFKDIPKGSSVLITTASLEIDVSAVRSGETSYRLHLGDGTFASAYADNAAWDLPSGDRAGYIGYIDLGSPADMGSTLFCQVDAVNKHVCPGSGLYGYLVTNGAYTPASGDVYKVTLRAIEA